MRILWLTWKDKEHPLSGGAEIVNEELAKRLSKDGHEVIFLTSNFHGGAEKIQKDGFSIIRLGNWKTVFWKAFWYYKRNLKGWADLIIDEMNTLPFGSKFYVKERNILFVHQLCRKVWFYQMKFPLSLLGYLVEPIYLRLINDRKVITVSRSSKKDLKRFGFEGKNVEIISEGIDLLPLKNLEKAKKFSSPTILSLGYIRPMKRTDHIVKAFEIAKKEIPELKLIVSGANGNWFGRKLTGIIESSPFRNSIEYLGKVSHAKKQELMQKSHIIAVTSVKEGWGLIVTEAGSQGTPAVVYNVDGLRDSVKNEKTGVVCEKNNPKDLAQKIVHLLKEEEKYKKLRKGAFEFSKKVNFENSYRDFLKAINNFLEK